MEPRREPQTSMNPPPLQPLQQPPSHVESMQQIRQEYRALLAEYIRQEQSISNINDLYRKFKLLKLYETEYEKNHELKKELVFWEQFRTPKEIYLESEITKLNSILTETQDKLRLFQIEQQKDHELIEHLRRLPDRA